MKYSVMDLFSGAGGLSLGFEQTKKFEIKIAFEKNIAAKKTYQKNHRYVKMYEDVCDANYLEIINKNGPIDIIIGGPPCQGFSNANRQHNSLINRNNRLIKEYIRAINEVKPKAFVMENVSMLKSNVHRFYFEKCDLDNLKLKNIKIREDLILLLEIKYFEIEYESIINDLDLINNHLWNNNIYSFLFSLYRHRDKKEKLYSIILKNMKKFISINEQLKNFDCVNSNILKLSKQLIYEITNIINGEIHIDSFINVLTQLINIQKMLISAKELYTYNIVISKFITNNNGLYAVVNSFSVIDYIYCNISDDYVVDSGVLSALEFGVPQKRKRFILIGVKKVISSEIHLPKGNIKDKAFSTVKQAIFDLESIPTSYTFDGNVGIEKLNNENYKSNEIFEKIKNSSLIYNHIIPQTRAVALERFKQIKPGQNFHSLNENLKKNTYSDFSRTQNTIYLRLNYNEPSGTVVNVRKSMWIHPNLNRGISVREAARLQTFPDNFIFLGTKDSQYQQVGNAVPPLLAKAIAKQIYETLEKF